MELRIVEIVLGEDAARYIEEPIGDVVTKGVWRSTLDSGLQLIRILVDVDQAEKLLDHCEEKYGELPEFRSFVLDLEATVPRMEPDEAVDENGDKKSAGLKKTRISREELYADVAETSETTINYLVLVALSTIVAALGLVRDNVAAVIGAMVIAPLLGPNMAISLATLLGDFALGAKAVKAIVIGLAEAIVLALALGLILESNPEATELVIRTKVGIGDVTLALCAGAAGALSFTGGISSVLVGVMVAVALLPPLTTCGLTLAHGNMSGAFGSALLFFTNMVCINLSGVVVFRLQGIRPGGKDNVRGAAISTAAAIVFWSILLAILVFIILKRGDLAI